MCAYRGKGTKVLGAWNMDLPITHSSLHITPLPPNPPSMSQHVTPLWTSPPCTGQGHGKDAKNEVRTREDLGDAAGGAWLAAPLVAGSWMPSSTKGKPPNRIPDGGAAYCITASRANNVSGEAKLCYVS